MTEKEIIQKLHRQQLIYEKYFSRLVHPMSSAVHRLLLSSDFACQKAVLIDQLLNHDKCRTGLKFADYQRLLKDISFETSEKNFAVYLRNFRHQQLFRLVLRELAGLAETDESLQTWSDCADALIIHTLKFCNQQLAKRYGQPRTADGEPIKLLCLAMGKLGGRELNFSSDIDLIFAYTKDGDTTGEAIISAQAFFTKTIQQFIRILQTVTAEGFVFRVDLRLRPNGESGPLAINLASMETYYQEQGRDWERYAMVKARLVNTNEDLQRELNHIIRPFVYRRYVDFSVLESLRGMKALIEREVTLKAYLDDIKRGKGGIREIEFIIQNIQLIRGGRLPQLQIQNAMGALSALKKEKLLPKAVALKNAYYFLRRLENALQLTQDRQTHALPEDELRQAQVTYGLFYSDWNSLCKDLQKHQTLVSRAFELVLKKPDQEEDARKILLKQLANLWHGYLEEGMAVNLLDSLGYQNPQRCYQLLYAFRHGSRCRRLSQAARLRLERFMVLLLTALAEQDKADDIFLQVIRLLENIVGRSAYLALLAENPNILKELFYWFAHSEFITSLLTQHPFLLETLLDQSDDWKPLEKEALERRLKEKLALCQDIESQEEVLRQFKLSNSLLAARAQLYQFTDAVRIAFFLTDVADLILKYLFELACERLVDKHPDIAQIKSRFAIIAYGKAGSLEMNFQSDLDLVFLHTASPGDEHLVTRLSQKLLHMLTIRTQAGVLYAVDTRLRPSGSSGLLVSHFDAYREYQQGIAWTWEHQALVKARVMIGTESFKQAFEEFKAKILLKHQDHQILGEQIASMRFKIGKYQHEDQLKFAKGGLLDLEFLIQFLVLSAHDPSLSSITHPLSQLQKLKELKKINSEQFNALTKAYRSYHHMQHASILGQELQDQQPVQEQLFLTIKQLFPALIQEE